MLKPALLDDMKLPFARRLQVANQHFSDASSSEEWMMNVVRDLLEEYRLVKQNKEQVRALLTRALEIIPNSLELISALIVDLGEASRYDDALVICRDRKQLVDLAMASDHFIDALLLSEKVDLEGWRGIIVLGLMGQRRFKTEEVRPVATAFGQQHAHVKHSLVSIYLWVKVHFEAIHFALLLGLCMPPAHRHVALCFVTMLLNLSLDDWPDDPTIWSNLCAQLNENPTSEEQVLSQISGSSPLDWLKSKIELTRCSIPATLAPFIIKRGNVWRLGELFIDNSSPSLNSSPIRKPTLTPTKNALPSIADLKQRLSSLQRLQPKGEKSPQVDVDGLFVLDTNILMGGMEWTESIERPIQLVIPMAVLAELHCLLNRPDKATRATEALEYLKEAKLKYLHSDGSLLLEPSVEEEVYSSSPSIRNNDDVILMATLLLRNADGPVCLVSDDVNMQLKGEAMKILVIDRRHFIGLIC